ncbi:MAG: UDP-N-acetylglucosamine 1-carboxyvinyltransferase [Planctomycetota bacterium]
MDTFVINGGRPLRGTVRINGSKNAALPLMAAALLTDHPLTLQGVPDLADTRNMSRLLKRLGIDVTHTPPEDHQPSRLNLSPHDPTPTTAPYDIVRTMRAGICVLGPMLAKRRAARVSMPGGCAIGDRPVDLHLRGLRALGAEIHLEAGDIVATTPRGGQDPLQAAHVFLGGPNGSTVLGTANVLSAATLAQGTTIIEAAACEPEIIDLANLLRAMGARISGDGSPRITVEGVAELNGVDAYPVMPDRIEAGTYVMAAAITNGEVVLENFPLDSLTAALDRLAHIGIHVEEQGVRSKEQEVSQTKNASTSSQALAASSYPTVTVLSPRRLNPTQVTTQPHPGFPTDLQAQIMALLTLADGNAIITEKIFPDRFLHVAELLRMGANITRVGPSAMVTGTRELVGAPVMASDLRASAGLVLAGLAAQGTTTINRVYHLDRGYHKMEHTLQTLGADIQRVDDKDL